MKKKKAKETIYIGGDLTCAYQYGRVDALMGENPERFSGGWAKQFKVSKSAQTEIYRAYIQGYNAVKLYLITPAKLQEI
jgi:hypothetical protein